MNLTKKSVTAIAVLCLICSSVFAGVIIHIGKGVNVEGGRFFEVSIVPSNVSLIVGQVQNFTVHCQQANEPLNYSWSYFTPVGISVSVDGTQCWWNGSGTFTAGNSFSFSFLTACAGLRLSVHVVDNDPSSPLYGGCGDASTSVFDPYSAPSVYLDALPIGVVMESDGSGWFRYTTNGQSKYSSTNASKVLDFAKGNLTGGGKIHLASGTYTDISCTVTDLSIIFEGDGPTTILKPLASSYAITFTSATSYINPGGVKDLMINGSDITGSCGVKFDDVQYGFLENLVIHIKSVGVLLTGNAASSAYNTKLRNVVVFGGSTAGSIGFQISPLSGQVCADADFSQCYVHDTDYGFKFTVGANGWRLENCGVLGAAIAGYWSEGAYSGGWMSGCFADQCAGDGFYFTDTATQISADIMLVNCWAASCSYGLYAIGNFVGYGVNDLLVVNSIFFVNNLAGVRLEKYVEHAKFSNCIIRDNDISNVSTIDATNFLIYNGPLYVEVYDSHIGWYYTNITNRAYVARVWQDASSPRSTIARFEQNTFMDSNNATKAKLGLNNTHVTYSINLFFSSNYAVENEPSINALVTEGSSTGIIVMHDIANWVIPVSTLPVASVLREGQVVYLRSSVDNKSEAYICMRTIVGSYAWVLLLDQGSQVEGASYIIYTDATYYYMKNGTTGRIDYSSTNASQVINNALGNLTSGRSYTQTVIMKGNFSVDSPLLLKNYTKLIIDGKLTASANMEAIIECYDDVAFEHITVEGGILDGNKDFGVVCGGINFTTTGDSSFLDLQHIKVYYTENTGVHLQKMVAGFVDDVSVLYCDSMGFYFSVVSDSKILNIGTTNVALENVYLSYCQTNYCGDWYLGGTSNGEAQFFIVGSNNNELANIRTDNTYSHGVRLVTSNYNSMVNFHITEPINTTKAALWLQGSFNNTATNFAIHKRGSAQTWYLGVYESDGSDMNLYSTFIINDCDTAVTGLGANSTLVHSIQNGVYVP